MSWDFETDAAYQCELDWVDQFVREEVEPVDMVIHHAWDLGDPVRQALIPPLHAIPSAQLGLASVLAAASPTKPDEKCVT